MSFPGENHSWVPSAAGGFTSIGDEAARRKLPSRSSRLVFGSSRDSSHRHLRRGGAHPPGSARHPDKRCGHLCRKTAHLPPGCPHPGKRWAHPGKRWAHPGKGCPHPAQRCPHPAVFPPHRMKRGAHLFIFGPHLFKRCATFLVFQPPFPAKTPSQPPQVAKFDQSHPISHPLDPKP